MDDRTAVVADARECCWQVGDGEVGEGGGVAGTRPALVDPEANAVVLDFPPGAGFGGSRDKLGAQHTAPEAASAIGVVSGKLNQRDGYGPEYGPSGPQSEVSLALSAATWVGLMPIDSPVPCSLNQASRAWPDRAASERPFSTSLNSPSTV